MINSNYLFLASEYTQPLRQLQLQLKTAVFTQVTGMDAMQHQTVHIKAANTNYVYPVVPHQRQRQHLLQQLLRVQVDVLFVRLPVKNVVEPASIVEIQARGVVFFLRHGLWLEKNIHFLVLSIWNTVNYKYM